MELGNLFEQNSDINVKPNKVEKVLAESKPNTAIDKTIMLKKKKRKRKKRQPRKAEDSQDIRFERRCFDIL